MIGSGDRTSFPARSDRPDQRRGIRRGSRSGTFDGRQDGAAYPSPRGQRPATEPRASTQFPVLPPPSTSWFGDVGIRGASNATNKNGTNPKIKRLREFMVSPSNGIKGGARRDSMYPGTLLHNIRIVAVELVFGVFGIRIAVNGAIDELNNVEHVAHFADTTDVFGSGFNLRKT